MEAITVGQYNLVYNIFSFTFACMFATFIFLVLSRSNVAPRYRGALTMSALVVIVAGYHYFRIFESWAGAFVIDGTSISVTGEPFNDAYRYIDWALTVPLLVAELVAVLGLARKEAGKLTFSLGFAALLMVILGYPGEIADSTTTRLIWGTLSTIPFVYILYVLFSQLGDTINAQTGEVKTLLKNARLLILATWGFYPIVYLLPVILPSTSGSTIVALQVGYAIADILAKAGYGILIYNIAKQKSEQLPEWNAVGVEAAPAAGD